MRRSLPERKHRRSPGDSRQPSPPTTTSPATPVSTEAGALTMIDRSQLPVIHYDFRTTGLVVFDMLEAYREPIEAAGSIGPTQRLIQACRGGAVPIFYARADHRADGADFARPLADTDSRFRPWGPDNPYRTVPPHASGSPG